MFTKNVRRSAILFCIFLMIFASLLQPNVILLPAEGEVTQSINSWGNEEALDYINTYSIGIWDLDYTKLSILCKALNVSMDYLGFSRVIEEYFLPLNVRFIGLQIGWMDHANTAKTDVRYNKWVDDFLSACDVYGISVLFWIRQWGFSYRHWDNEVWSEHPELRTYDRYGNMINPGDYGGKVMPLRIDHPNIIEQFKNDLKQIYSYYGEHESWIGFGSYSGDYKHYAASDTGLRDCGFNNETIIEFFKSIYYHIDVSADGFHKDGTFCKLWEMLHEYQPLMLLKSGDKQSVSMVEVYGGIGSGGRAVALKFKAPENMDGFKIKWYGYKIGIPTDLVLELYTDDGQDNPLQLGFPITSVVQLSESVTNTKGWQGDVVFNARLAKGEYYWIVLYTLGGDASNKYVVYYREYRTDESRCKITTDGFSGAWQGKRNAILWVMDLNNSDKLIYPYQERILSYEPQTFTAPYNMTVNTLFLYISDLNPDGTTLSARIVKVSNNAVLAEGTFDVTNFKGTYWWLHTRLNNRIKLLSGEKYRIEVSIPSSEWQLSSLRTDPPQCGFQGQSEYLLFGLGDFMESTELANFDHTDIAVSADPITPTNWVAVRIKPTITSQLSKVEVNVGSGSGQISMALFSDYDGTGKRPGNKLEEKIVESQLGWVSTTNWTNTLNAGNWYWIVFSATSQIKLCYKTNPYKYTTMYTSDSGTHWRLGLPVSPADVVFSVSTKAETFANEPESIGWLDLTTMKYVAQSFSPSINMPIRGALVWLSQGPDDMSDIFIELRTDNGTDSPSPSILASGTIRGGSFTGKGFALVDFTFPVNLTSNRKYWLVIRSSALTSSSKILVAYYRSPSYSFGGTGFKVKVSLDGGLTWILPNEKEADIIFSIVGPSVMTPLFNTTELASDIGSYHAFKISDEPLHGWNTYLNLFVAKILKELKEWFEGYTGREWMVIDTNTLRMMDEVGLKGYFINMGNVGPIGYPPPDSFFDGDMQKKLLALLRSINSTIIPWSSLGCKGDNLGSITPEQIGIYYRFSLPVLARKLNIFDVDSTSLMNKTQQAESGAYGEILKRMVYNGVFFGKEKKAVKALFIGDMDIGTTLAYLTPAVDVTLEGFEGINGDYNLTKHGDFSQFDVIVWLSSRPSMSEITANARERIKAFVQNGGGFVSISGWEDWANEILGFDYGGESISPGSMIYVNYSHPILRPFTDISEYAYYWRNRKIIRTTGTYIVKDSNNMPWISENNYGSGRGIFIGIPINRFDGIGSYPPTYYGAPRSSWLVLFTNAIFYAAGEENMLPVWWFENTYRNQHPWHSELRYSVNGKPGGPILLWISNNNVTTNFEFHMKASFYGIDPKGWIAIDVQRWKVVARGSGEEITISVEVPAQSWMPIYIMNSTSNLRIAYSNLPVTAEEINQKSGSYTLLGFYNQTGWLVVSSLTSPTTVIANNTGTLSQTQTIENLNSSIVKTGWYYDSASKLLFIKFKTTSPVQILVTQSSNDYTLADFPQPMLSEDLKLNHTAVIASSAPHGPCGGAHTMDVMGATLVAAKLGLKARGGTPSSILDDSLASYETQTGAITIKDTANNLIVFGGPGVNIVTRYYNELKDQLGNRVLQAYFLKDAEGKDYIYVGSSGKSYFIEYDAQGRKRADYSLIELYYDENYGRWVLIVAGLGGEGTWAASKLLSTYENWDLSGNGMIVKYADTNADGYLDTITIEESVYEAYAQQSGTYFNANESFNADFGIAMLPLTLLMCGIYMFTSPLRRCARIKKFFTVATFTFLMAGTILIESNIVGAAPQYSLSNFPSPFISESKLLNYTFVVADSNGHAPCGGAHTMDVMGAILVAKKLGMTAAGGMPEAVMDDYIASYDPVSCSLTLIDTVHNLVSFGGPGVNMITKYYNDLKDESGSHVLKAYFMKDGYGVDYIYVQSTGKAYYIEYDDQGRKKTDYAMIHLHYDENYGRWVLIVAGLGGEGTWAASKLLSTYENWNLSEAVAILKYFDSNEDGYLDTIAIVDKLP